MTSEATLRKTLIHSDVNGDFTEAVLRLDDGSRLCFCHRVGERWAKAVGPEGREEQAGTAGQLLADITLFRVNAKHLDIQFADGSRWDEPLRVSNNSQSASHVSSNESQTPATSSSGRGTPAQTPPRSGTREAGQSEQIIPGIVLTVSGEANVDPALADVLFDLAVQLEEAVQLPVDVQHVVAAIVLASRAGRLNSQTSLDADDPVLTSLLADPVRTVFATCGGRVGEED